LIHVESATAPATRPIGLHLQTRPHFVKAARRAVEIGATAVQLFSDNPAAWRRRTEPPATLPEFLATLRSGGVTAIAIHGPYLLNMAAPDGAIRERTVATIGHELRTASRYGALGVNVHIGSHVGAGLESGVVRIGDAASRALAEAPIDPRDPNPPLLVLENSAGGGGGIGATVEELAAVLDAAAAAGGDPARIAFCLDTAHLWGAGYDIRTPEGLDDVLVRFERLLGLDRLRLVHLNDSRAGLGSRLDRHEHIAAGQIGVDGIATVLAEPRLVRVPMVVETDTEGGLDAADQERIRLLLAGERDLPPLPDPSSAARPKRRHAAKRVAPKPTGSGASSGTSGL
jgi:deoxyribonuclease-4